MIDHQFIQLNQSKTSECEQPVLIAGGNLVKFFTEEDCSNADLVGLDGTVFSRRALGVQKIKDGLHRAQISSLGAAKVGDCARLRMTLDKTYSGVEYAEPGLVDDMQATVFAVDRMLPAGKYTMELHGVHMHSSHGIGYETEEFEGYFEISAVEGAKTTFVGEQRDEDYTIQFELENDMPAGDVELWLSITDSGIGVPQGDYFEMTIRDIDLKSEGQVLASNLLKVVDPTDKEVSIVEYGCNEDCFGIPFSHGSLTAILPILIKDPQPKQSDEVYTTLSGENIVLYSEMTKEYTLETEYLDEKTHDRIMMALMSDHIIINGKSVCKSGDYEIDWDNSMRSDCGRKMAKAKCKVKENVVNRNSN